MPAEEPWTQAPPSWALPVTVAGALVLIRQADVLACIAPMCAYPTGLLFSLTISFNPRTADNTAIEFYDRGPAERVPLTRLQVRFDGEVLDSAAPRTGRTGDRVPVLRNCGAHSTSLAGHPHPKHESTWWLSPLPPAGPIEFALYLQGESEQSGAAHIDASQITNAAHQSVILRAEPGTGL